MESRPTLKEEKKLWQKGYRWVVGLDEVGIGPLAGPVVACAVVVKQNLKDNLQITNLKDSKKLTFQKREEFYKVLIRNPVIKWGVGIVSEKVIDKINIKNAAELAMEKALKQLERKIKTKAEFLIIDGSYIKNSKLKSYRFKLIPKADEKVFSCAIASIIAKVKRDRIMMNLHQKYSKYGFDKNKGYPTRFHIKALRRYGPSRVHRKSFEPVEVLSSISSRF